MTGGINFLNTVHSYTHSKRLTLGLKQRHLTSFGRYVQGVYTINIIQVNGRCAAPGGQAIDSPNTTTVQGDAGKIPKESIQG